MARKQQEILDFQKNIKPFGDLLQTMYEQSREILLSKTDNELNQIITDTEHLTETNCWWASYHMIEVVAYEAKIILRNRQAGELTT
jgi:hypothetical protein